MPSQRDLTTVSIVWYSRTFPIYAPRDQSYTVTRRLAHSSTMA